MTATNFVPKVHPATRLVEADDPMELVANPVPGDPDFMLDCMIQEFAWMGTDRTALFGMFHNPEYPVLNQLRAYFGPDEVRRRIDEIIGNGVIQVDEFVDPTPDPDDDHESGLIELTVLQRC
jgi:hypothetical protein